MNGLLDSLKALGTPRLVSLAAVATTMLGLLAIVSLNTPKPNMALLYGDLDLKESAQIVEALERQKIPYIAAAGGSEIMVPADLVARTRLDLARGNLPTGGSVGYEIFDKGDSLTASSFQQQLNVTRALEGELARTIRGIQGIKSARVHIVLPRREPFARDQQGARASIQLTMIGLGRLDPEGVHAILNLVSAAVPGLHPEDVAITDTKGRVLAQAGKPTGAADLAQNTVDMRHAAETRLSQAVEDMLERSIGKGHVRAEASLDYDYDQIHETQEKYDPDGQVVRSQQNQTSTSKTTEANSTVSVQNNLPNADTGANQAGSQDQKTDETTNYEIGKTVRTMVHDQPRLSRISLAVMIDQEAVKGPDGRLIWKDRDPQEIERISRLVRSAIGFNEQRGDTVEIATMRFLAPEDADQAVPDAAVLGLLDQQFLLKLAHLLLIACVCIVVILAVIRPMTTRLAIAPKSSPLGLPDAALRNENGEPVLFSDLQTMGAIGSTAGGRNLPALTSSQGGGGASNAAAGAQDDENMINIANVEGQLRASSIRRLADLVEKHPEESLSIVRAWMHQEAA